MPPPARTAVALILAAADTVTSFLAATAPPTPSAPCDDSSVTAPVKLVSPPTATLPVPGLVPFEPMVFDAIVATGPSVTVPVVTKLLAVAGP